MKTVKVVLLAVAITLGGLINVNAKEEPAKDDLTTITKKIERILEQPGFDVNEEMLVKVTLVINKDNEMVVLSIDSENEDVSYYIKNKLNYYSVSADTFHRNGKYILPVRLIPSR